MVISEQYMYWYYTLKVKKITASSLSPICAVGDFMISLKGKLVSNRYTHLCKKMRDKSLAGLLLPVNAR